MSWLENNKHISEIQSTQEREKAHSHIETIKRSTKRAAAIIRGLQNISREGSADESDLFSIGESLDEVLILMGSKFKFEEIDLKYEKDDPLFQIKFQLQRVQFSQVVLNLMSNAFYAIKDQERLWSFPML